MEHNFTSRFIKGVAFTSLGTFSQIVLGFLGIILAVRLISKEEFGIFILLQVIAVFFVMLSGLALEDIAVTKFIASLESDKKMELTNTAMCYKLLIAIIMSLIILMGKPLIYYLFKSEQLSRLLIFIPLFYFLSSYYELLLKILQGFHQYRKMAISQIINSGGKFLLIIIFLAVLEMNVIGLILAFLISFAMSILFMYLVLPVKRRFNLNPGLIRELFKFGFPLGLNSILSFIFLKIDRFMIGAMINPVGVAYYEVASKIPDSGRRSYESFQSVFFPNMSELFAKKRYEKAEQLLNNSLRLISFLIIFAALVVMLFQKDIVRLLFSERYLESAPALSLLMVGLGIGLISNVMGISLVALGQSDKPVKINIVNTITNVVGNLVMIPIFGFIGAVYATLLSRSVTNPFIVWFLKRSNIKVKVSLYLKPIIVFGVCGILFLIIKPEIVMIKVFLIFLFLFLSFVLSVIKRKDLSILFKGIMSSSAELTK